MRLATRSTACGRRAWSQGIIHDVPTVKELIDRIVAEAEEIISRLGGVFSALPAASR